LVMPMADGLNAVEARGGRPWKTRRLSPLLFAVFTLVAASGLAWFGYGRYRVNQLWVMAQDALRDHDPRSAMASLDQFTARKPRDLDGLFLAARTARRLGKFPEAKRYLAAYEDQGGSKDKIRLERDLMLVQQGLIGDTDKRLRATVGPDLCRSCMVLERR